MIEYIVGFIIGFGVAYGWMYYRLWKRGAIILLRKPIIKNLE